MKLEIGLTHSITKTVTPDDSACKVGSGLVDVFATPSMIALCEETCSELVQPYLNKNEVTVGCEVHINHMNATKIGSEVKCTGQIIKIEDRKLLFRVVVTEKGKIVGLGQHLRFIVDKERFMNKLK